MAACRAAYRSGGEICAFKEYIGCFHSDTGIKSAEHSGNAHGACGRAYHQVFCVKMMLYTVKRGERSALCTAFHIHFVAVYFCYVKAVQWLSNGIENVIGGIYYTVDGALSYGNQAIWGFL